LLRHGLVVGPPGWALECNKLALFRSAKAVLIDMYSCVYSPSFPVSSRRVSHLGHIAAGPCTRSLQQNVTARYQRYLFQTSIEEAKIDHFNNFHWSFPTTLRLTDIFNWGNFGCDLMSKLTSISLCYSAPSEFFQDLHPLLHLLSATNRSRRDSGYEASSLWLPAKPQ
jgi:hypothetical protein